MSQNTKYQIRQKSSFLKRETKYFVIIIVVVDSYSIDLLFLSFSYFPSPLLHLHPLAPTIKLLFPPSALAPTLQLTCFFYFNYILFTNHVILNSVSLFRESNKNNRKIYYTKLIRIHLYAFATMQSKFIISHFHIKTLFHHF